MIFYDVGAPQTRRSQGAVTQSPDKRFTIGSSSSELHFCGVLGVLPLATGCALAVVTQVSFMSGSSRTGTAALVRWGAHGRDSFGEHRLEGESSRGGLDARLPHSLQATLAAVVDKHRILRITETRVFALPGRDPIKSAFVAAMRTDRIMR